MLLSTLSLNSGKENTMKSTKFAQSQTNMNDWEYKAERQQEKKASQQLRKQKQGRKGMWMSGE